MRFVDNFCLDAAAENLRIVIIDAVPELLHVLLRLMLEFRVAEHIADLLQMIRGLQSNEAITSALVFIESTGSILFISAFLTATEVRSDLSPARASPAFLRKVGEISRNDEIQVFEAVPQVEPGGELFRILRLLHLTELGTDDLDEDLILLKERGLQLEN